MVISGKPLGKKRRQMCLLSQQQYISASLGQTSRADLTSMLTMFCVLLTGDNYPNFLGKNVAQFIIFHLDMMHFWI